jgi:phosphoesterase RecJ-like protein
LTSLPEISIVQELLSSKQRVVILTHRNPDGDAIGSALAVQGFLGLTGHETAVIFPSDWPSVYGFLNGVHDAIVYDREKERALQVIKEATVIMLLDLNAIDRIDEMGPAVKASTVPKLLIDHHLEPEEDLASWMLSDPSASSTAELVHVLIEMLGQTHLINKDIANALFTGIITDTGSFRFATNPRVFRVCAALKEAGADDYRLQNMIYNSLTDKQLRLIGHCIANRMELLPEYRTGIIHLTQEDFKEFSVGRGDTDGIVNYILMLRSMRIAIFITDQASIIKLSFRSKGNVSVQELARTYFGGGGHRNAAGGFSRKPLEEVLRDVKEILPKYLEQQGWNLPKEQSDHSDKN